MADNADIFSSEPVTTEGTVDLGLNDLVGEGRKYRDPDELAKAYAHLESHARKLEAENAEARAARDRLEATNNAARPQEDGNNRPTDDNPQVAPSQNAPNAGNQNVDIRSQIKEEVKALNEQERMVNNMETAAAKMVEVYGSKEKANEAVRAKAQELGVGVQWLQDAAARSPTAFFATMGLNGSTGGNRVTPASGGGVNIGGSGESVRNFEYYDKLRKDNPKLYFSAATQSEMMRQARTMGGDFYKR